MVKNKTVVISLMFVFLVLALIPCTFATSENWVEVARFEGSESSQRKLFTCEYPEWRITWKFTPSHEAFHFKESLKFSITIFAQNASIDDYASEGQENYFIVNKIDPILFERTNIEILGDGAITYNIETRRYAESGISIVNDHVGTFYMSVETSWLVNDYTIIIEQNVDSNPEFPTGSASVFEERRFWLHDAHDFYNVTIVSNSTISDFYFLYDSMRISFYVNGTAGTTGLCNVTIPSEFMSTEFSIFKDEKPLVKNTDYTETFNGTHYLFTITYEHSTHLIQIYANNNIPEFPSLIILPLFLVVTLIGIIFKNKIRKRGSK